MRLMVSLFLQLVMLNIACVGIFSDSLRTVGIVYGLIKLLLLNLKMFQLCNWLLLFHLSYYSISYRICNLTSIIESKNDQDGIEDAEKVAVVSDVPSQRTKALRTCAYLIDQIRQATHEMNSTFSLSILLFLIFIMIFCSICLFFFIYVMAELVVHPSLKDAVYMFPAAFVVAVIMALVILTSADYPVNQVSQISFIHLKMKLNVLTVDKISRENNGIIYQ